MHIDSDRQTFAPSAPSSRINGAEGEARVCGLPGPERSGARVRHRSHRDAGEHRNNVCTPARLLCQRVASQAGKTGACKFRTVELWKQPSIERSSRGKQNRLIKCLHLTFRNPSMDDTTNVPKQMLTGLPRSILLYDLVVNSVLSLISL